MNSRTQTKGKLLLIPNLISDDGEISDEVRAAIKDLKYYLVETPKVARRFLRKADRSLVLENLEFTQYNKDTPRSELEESMQVLRQGVDVGIITDSGMPGIADPGSSAVRIAHDWGITVKPLTGSSSILLALAASGFSGQQFCFHGYLPIQTKECTSKLKNLEKDSANNNCSQVFIETPYRNEKLLKLMLKVLKPETRLCIAHDITGEKEKIISKPAKNWTREPFIPGKLPCVFIIYSGS